jgi:heme/copper-type cytochrome/quinol oxidase subunit 2
MSRDITRTEASHMTRTHLTLVAGVIFTALAVAACGTGAAAKIEPSERSIYLAAIEPKGGVTVDKEPFPQEALPAGGGYILKEPDENGRWEVSTYRWSQNEIVVMQGDKVTLEIIGINGASHPSTIEGYDIDFDVKRGQLTTLTFTADKAGVFRFVCHAHLPSMTGTLIVLPTD